MDCLCVKKYNWNLVVLYIRMYTSNINSTRYIEINIIDFHYLKLLDLIIISHFQYKDKINNLFSGKIDKQTKQIIF